MSRHAYSGPKDSSVFNEGGSESGPHVESGPSPVPHVLQKTGGSQAHRRILSHPGAFNHNKLHTLATKHTRCASRRAWTVMLNTVNTHTHTHTHSQIYVCVC